MPYENLLYERSGNVAIITLNRPSRLNALSFGLQSELVAIVDAMRKDDEVHTAVITGAPGANGRPCFSAGGDLKERYQLDGSTPAALGYDTWEEALVRTLAAMGQGRDIGHHSSAAIEAVATFEKPTIAAIDGICTAGGLELALACDLRTATETAQISDLHMANLGNLGGGGLQSRLPRIVGLAKAQELIWTGDVIDGNEAWRIGLVNRVFPAGQLMAGTMALANRLASMRTRAMQFSKLVTRASLSQGEFESLRFSDFAEALLKSSDTRHSAEVYKAFAEKRRPEMGR